MEIIYETHSISTDNETGIATGWLPGELSRAGRALAAELGERRRGDDLEAVFTSDLWRAVETAEIAFVDQDVAIFRDVRLRECDYGELNGKAVALLNGNRAAHIERPWPGGQSYRDVVDQTRTFLTDLARRFDGTRVLIIAHSANRWALQHLLLGERLEDLVDAPFDWRPGRRFRLPADGPHRASRPAVPSCP